MPGDRRPPTGLELVQSQEPMCPYCTLYTDVEMERDHLVLVTIDDRKRVAHNWCFRARQRGEVHAPIPHEAPPPV